MCKSTRFCATFFPTLLIFSGDSREQAFPKVRGPQWNMLGMRLVGLVEGSASGLVVRQHDGAFAIGDEPGSQVGCGDPKSVGMVAKRPVVKLGEFPDASLNAGTDRGGPENAMLAELQVAVVPLRQKLRDFLIRGASKEKDFVEIALTGKFGFALRQARVLRQLSRG